MTSSPNPLSLIRWTAKVSGIDSSARAVGGKTLEETAPGNKTVQRQLLGVCVFSPRPCTMLPRRMLWGAVTRHVAPRRSHSGAAQPQVGTARPIRLHGPTWFPYYTLCRYNKNKKKKACDLDIIQRPYVPQTHRLTHVSIIMCNHCLCCCFLWCYLSYGNSKRRWSFFFSMPEF